MSDFNAHIYILGFSILICQKIVIETNCIETHKVILNEHMYVYNIVEAQNKSAQKKYANLICNMQIVLKKYLQVYTWSLLPISGFVLNEKFQ